MTEAARTLLPHQRQLVDEYRLGSAPAAVVLDAPPGAGKSRALAVIAAERAESGGLVIVVVPRSLVLHWSNELSFAGVARATVYNKPAEFRLALDAGGTAWPSAGVVVCASSVMRSPLAAKALGTIVPSLLIADDVTASAESALGRLLRSVADRARQVIVTAGGGPKRWYPPGELRTWTYPLRDNAGFLVSPRFSYRIRQFEGDPVEAGLIQEALALLRRIGFPVPGALLTRPAIQSALLGVVHRLEAPQQLSLWQEGQQELELGQEWRSTIDRGVLDSVWMLLDRFDDLATDRRLSDAIAEVQASRSERQPVVVICDRLREVDYVLAAMYSENIPSVAITGQTPPEERVSALSSTSTGVVLVITSAFISMQTPLPGQSRCLWFTPPRSADQIRRWLGPGIASRAFEIILLKASPPTTPADDLVDELIKVLNDPWAEPDDGVLA